MNIIHINPINFGRNSTQFISNYKFVVDLLKSKAINKLYNFGTNGVNRFTNKINEIKFDLVYEGNGDESSLVVIIKYDSFILVHDKMEYIKNDFLYITLSLEWTKNHIEKRINDYFKSVDNLSIDFDMLDNLLGYHYMYSEELLSYIDTPNKEISDLELLQLRNSINNIFKFTYSDIEKESNIFYYVVDRSIFIISFSDNMKISLYRNITNDAIEFSFDILNITTLNYLKPNKFAKFPSDIYQKIINLKNI